MDDSPDPLKPKYKRVLLKLSGEGFGTPGKSGINIDDTTKIATPGETSSRSRRPTGDRHRRRQSAARRAISGRRHGHQENHRPLHGHVGDRSQRHGVAKLPGKHRLRNAAMTAIRMETVAEPYIHRRAIRHLEKGRIVILAGGTGNPFVTTDTAAALRACELEVNILLKATKVDGVYSDDPEINPHAQKYPKLTHAQVIKDTLRVMDAAAIDMCRTAKLPILVFNFNKEGNIERAIAGQAIGTLVES